MERHEKYCTSNPDRECRICDKLQEVQEPLKRLLEVYEKGNLPELRKVTNCPMCILWTLKAYFKNTTGEPWDAGFDFKKELQEFWDEENSVPKYGEDY